MRDNQPHAAIIRTTKRYARWREQLGITWRRAAELGIEGERAARKNRRATKRLLARADAATAGDAANSASAA